MEFRERNGWQLLRVSREAHELTKQIDSWSKSSNAAMGHQKFIVNDLLRGAMELQESVLILSRLQEDPRSLSMMKTMQRGAHEYDEIIPHGFLPDRCSTNRVQDMRQVIANRLYKINNVNDPLTKPLILSNSLTKMKAPNLIAKLMGLEDYAPIDNPFENQKLKKKPKPKKLDEIIETMRCSGVLKTESSESLATDSAVPPIVIMRPQHLSSMVSEASDLIFKNYNGKEQLDVGKEKVEPVQKFKKEAHFSQRELKCDVSFKDKKRVDDAKRIEDNDRTHGEKKAVKTVGERIKPQKRETTPSFATQNRKNGFSTRSTSFSSSKVSSSKINSRKANSSKASTSKSINERKASVQKPIRNLSKAVDKEYRNEKLKCQTENHAISRSRNISAADGLPLRQVQKEPTKAISKARTRKSSKTICEVMPKSYRTGRSSAKLASSIKKPSFKPPAKTAAEIKSHLKPLLLSSQSFCNHVHALFGANVFKPSFLHTTFSEEHEIFNDRLLLDSATELITRKSHEGKASIHRLTQSRTKNRLAYRSFTQMVDEIGNGIAKLESYSEFDNDDDDGTYRDKLDLILEKDLRCGEAMLDAMWDDWACVEDGDETALEMVERILFGLLLDVAKELLGEKDDLKYSQK